MGARVMGLVAHGPCRTCSHAQCGDGGSHRRRSTRPSRALDQRHPRFRDRTPSLDTCGAEAARVPCSFSGQNIGLSGLSRWQDRLTARQTFGHRSRLPSETAAVSKRSARPAEIAEAAGHSGRARRSWAQHDESRSQWRQRGGKRTVCVSRR
jgi:hypothetical protein